METIDTKKMMEINKRNKRRTGCMIRAFRVLRDNPDLFLTMFLVFSCITVGWFACRFWLGLTASEIKTEITEAVLLIGFVLTSVSTAIGSLFVKKGQISSSLSGRVEREHDIGGNSIVPQ